MVISQRLPPPAPSASLPEFAQLHKYFTANPNFGDSNPKAQPDPSACFLFFHHRILTRPDTRREGNILHLPAGSPRAGRDWPLPRGKTQTFRVSRINRAGEGRREEAVGATCSRRAGAGGGRLFRVHRSLVKCVSVAFSSFAAQPIPLI